MEADPLSLSIETILWAGRTLNRGSNPGRGMK